MNPIPLDAHTGAALRRRRQSLGLAQKTIQHRARLSHIAVSNIEHNRGVRLSSFQAHLAALGLKIVIVEDDHAKENR